MVNFKEQAKRVTKLGASVSDTNVLIYGLMYVLIYGLMYVLINGLMYVLINGLMYVFICVLGFMFNVCFDLC